MNNSEKVCPKCNGKMEIGFTPDYSYMKISVSSWVRGIPKKSFISKLLVPYADRIPIAAYRCTKCGFIEYYSDEKFRPT
jgi:ribosomal protein L40E